MQKIKVWLDKWSNNIWWQETIRTMVKKKDTTNNSFPPTRERFKLKLAHERSDPCNSDESPYFFSLCCWFIRSSYLYLEKVCYKLLTQVSFGHFHVRWSFSFQVFGVGFFFFFFGDFSSFFYWFQSENRNKNPSLCFVFVGLSSRPAYIFKGQNPGSALPLSAAWWRKTWCRWSYVASLRNKKERFFRHKTKCETKCPLEGFEKSVSLWFLLKTGILVFRFKRL